MAFDKMTARLGQNKKIVTFFSVNLLLSIIPLAVMFAQHRIPSTHDTFAFLISQFNIYNDAVTKGILPYWMPFTAHGQNAALTVSIQLTPFEPVQLLLGFLGIKINFLWFYFLGMWFDEFMFQIGIFLLATIYYLRLETAIFVAISLVGGIVWSCQMWNFNQIYFLPLALYALHKTISSRELKWLFALALFLSFGLNSVATYNIIFTLFALTVYLLAISPVHGNDFRYFLNSRSALSFGLKTVAVAALFGFSVISISQGMNSLEVGGRGRDASGNVPLDTFMTYGGSIGFEKYFDFIFRAPQSHDMSLYAGALLIPLALLGIIYHRRGYAVSLLATSLILFLFCAGTPVTTAAYYLFPGFKYFRHIGLVAPVLKVFLVFLAGYGFDALMVDKSRMRIGCLIVASYCLLTSTLYWVLGSSLLPVNLPPVYAVDIVPFFMATSALAVVSLAALANKRIAGIYPALILIVLVIDLLVYRFQYQVLTVPVASNEFVAMFEPVDYGFQMNRDDTPNIRFNQFDSTPHSWGDRNLAFYNSLDWFFYKDFASSPFMVQTKEKPVAELPDYVSGANGGQGNNLLSGELSQPKLKVYRDIRPVKNVSALRELLVTPAFRGDFLYTEDSHFTADGMARNNPSDNPGESDRIPADFEVIKFSSNGLTLKVNVPLNPGSENRRYLYYADAYHPFWKARVNGKETPVIKANIAYKAVEIPSGNSVVEFFIYNPLMASSMLLAQALALLAFIIISYLCVRWCKDSQTAT